MNPEAAWLAQLSQQDHRRSLSTAPPGIDFCSNDYLGLSHSLEIRRRLIQDLEAGCPLGATGSRLISGDTVVHREVEKFLRGLYDCESALVVSSGYLANLAVLGAFAALSTEVFSDELNHASLVDGCRLLKAHRSVFRHGDLQDLEDRLRRSSAPTKVILVESVFSMDGDVIALDSLIELARRSSAWLVVDEAHATGVLGSRSLGLTADHHRHYERLISVHPAGKAIGGQGAWVISSSLFRDLVINAARAFIFSTAPSPILARQIQHAVQVAMEDPSPRQRLEANVRTFRQSLDLFASPSPIIPWIAGSNRLALAWADALIARGFWVRAIRSPTVPRGTERLRLTLRADHLPCQVLALAAALREL